MQNLLKLVCWLHNDIKKMNILLNQTLIFQSSQLDLFYTLIKKTPKSVHICLDHYKNKQPARWGCISNRAK